MEIRSTIWFARSPVSRSTMRPRIQAERCHLAGVAVQPTQPERVLGLHHLVDLRRALVDDRGARVAEVALDAVLGRVAVRAEDLDGEVGRLEGRLGRVPFRQRGLTRV